ncbi:hypothetical protein V7S43_016043 [Phytophthora oleae]|uniref:Uncharacterized protein n=1 Tax=Phytophthora oleae TaxID=2107226 RepID=A0ABD3F0P4_9STRA
MVSEDFVPNDPNLCAGDSTKAMWYEEMTLQIHIASKKGRDALTFENELLTEIFAQHSPLECYDVSTLEVKKAVKKASDRKKSFWSDVPTASAKGEIFKEEHEEAGDAAAGSDLELDLDDLLDSGEVTSVGSTT